MKRAFMKEPAREIPVTGSYDVIVAGGGIAGVAAAVAAARQGANVCLLERTFSLGGLATIGNVAEYLPLCDGKGRQVSAGLALELAELAVSDLGNDNQKAGFVGVPACWRAGGDREDRSRTRFAVRFNPFSYQFHLEKLVLSSGIRLLYDTRVCGAARKGSAVSHVVVENKSGRSALACRTVVDATGDADICFLAGEKTESLDSNVPCGWFYYLSPEGFALQPFTIHFSATGEKEGDGPFFRGDDADDVTSLMVESRRAIEKKLAQIRAKFPGADIQLIAAPTLACFRMTRRLVSDFSLGKEHMHQWFEDTVGIIADWRRPGPVYAIPLRCLAGSVNANLLAAGRCISADRTSWDATRAIAPCAVTGEAAGVAAALAARTAGGDLRQLSIPLLQERLKTQGVLLDPQLALPA